MRNRRLTIFVYKRKVVALGNNAKKNFGISNDADAEDSSHRNI